MGDSKPHNPSRPRYAPQRPFPPYRHQLGVTPHPRTNPAGHSYGLPEPAGAGTPLAPESWAVNETYLYGVDLYNHAYWWESHEQWELLWRMAESKSRTALFLRGLIQASATLLKKTQENDRGVQQLFQRSHANLMAAVDDPGQPYMGLAIIPFIASLQQYIEVPGEPVSSFEATDAPTIQLSSQTA